MKLLCIQPGASYSTADVHQGLVKQFMLLGHEVIEYNLDVRIMRASSWLGFNWEKAVEQGFSLPRPTPNDVQYQAGAEAVLVALRHMPDWVIVTSGMYLHPDAYIMLKRAGFAVCTIFTESPYDDHKQVGLLQNSDIVFCNDQVSVDEFSQYHKQVYYLPHSYDPEKHYVVEDSDKHSFNPDQPDVPAHDVVFVGTGFRERLDILGGVDWTGIDLGLYGSYDLLEEMPDVAEKLKPYIHDEIVDNAKTASLYRKAKIGINIHRQSRGFGMDAVRIVSAHSTNPRMIELAACGVFTLSDYRREVELIFGSLVPTFSTANELETLVRKWLQDDEARRAVAQKLPEAVKRHTFAARAATISSILSDQREPTWRNIMAGRASSISARLDQARPLLSLR